MLQVGAVWVQTNITPGASEHTQAAADADAGPIFAKMRALPSADMRTRVSGSDNHHNFNAAIEESYSYDLWDQDKAMGYKCDPVYRSADCSIKKCKYCMDPLFYDNMDGAIYQATVVHLGSQSPGYRGRREQPAPPPTPTPTPRLAGLGQGRHQRPLQGHPQRRVRRAGRDRSHQRGTRHHRTHRARGARGDPERRGLQEQPGRDGHAPGRCGCKRPPRGARTTAGPGTTITTSTSTTATTASITTTTTITTNSIITTHGWPERVFRGPVPAAIAAQAKKVRSPASRPGQSDERTPSVDNKMRGSVGGGRP